MKTNQSLKPALTEVDRSGKQLRNQKQRERCAGSSPVGRPIFDRTARFPEGNGPAVRASAQKKAFTGVILPDSPAERGNR